MSLFSLRHALFFALVSTVLLGGDAFSQDCHTCGSNGYRDCKQHRRLKAHIELIQNEGFLCSNFIECRDCSGTGFRECSSCDVDPKENEAYAEWKRQVAKNQAWLAKKVKEIDDQMKIKCLVGESKHFYMVWMVPKLKIGRRNVPQHELLPIYLKRMEDHRADYLSIFGLKSGALAPKTKVMVWQHQVDNERAAQLYTGIGSGGTGVKFFGADPVYTTVRDRKKLRTDDEVHRHLVHNVAQLLLSSQKPAQWVGNIKGGWLDEGIAHFFEDRYWELCTNYCYVEVDTMEGFKGGHYKPAIYQLVKRGKTIPAPGIMVKNTEMLIPQEHAQVFSYVDYLIAKDPQKFVRMATLMKRKKPSAEAIKQAYGMNIFEFEKQWQEWVLKTYPPR